MIRPCRDATPDNLPAIRPCVTRYNRASVKQESEELANMFRFRPEALRRRSNGSRPSQLPAA